MGLFLLLTGDLVALACVTVGVLLASESEVVGGRHINSDMSIAQVDDQLEIEGVETQARGSHTM